MGGEVGILRAGALQVPDSNPMSAQNSENLSCKSPCLGGGMCPVKVDGQAQQ